MLDDDVLIYWINKTFPNFSWETGTALWNAFINREVITPDGKPTRGSFRWWGGIIAEARNKGETYADYYCSLVPQEGLLEDVEEKMLAEGWKLEFKAKICPKCGKPMERGDMLAINMVDGTSTHAICEIEEEK